MSAHRRTKAAAGMAGAADTGTKGERKEERDDMVNARRARD